MDYQEIDLRESANKDFQKIPKQFLKNIIQKISTLKENPFPHGCIKLSGSKNIFRIRIGDYRVISRVNKMQKIVYIDYVSHRKDVYR